MSDTSGTGGFGPATRGVRNKLSTVFSSPSTRSTTQTSHQIGNGKIINASPNNIDALVWQELKKHDKLEEVFLPPELIFYLEEMARFIDTAKAGGLAEVIKKFGLQEESTFPSLRRSISNRAPGNSLSKKDGSEMHSQAGGAFNAGSVKWAEEIDESQDPTQISIRSLVEKIRSNNRYDEALKKSARDILEEYCQRVLHAYVHKDDPWAAKADATLDTQIRGQLDDFFGKHPSADEWTSKKIAKTLEAIAASLTD